MKRCLFNPAAISFGLFLGVLVACMFSCTRWAWGRNHWMLPGTGQEVVFNDDHVEVYGRLGLMRRVVAEFDWRKLGIGLRPIQMASNRPVRSWMIGYSFPMWWLALPFAVMPLIWVWRERRSRRRWFRGLCMDCGYDLRASPGRCPECGLVRPARIGRARVPIWFWSACYLLFATLWLMSYGFSPNGSAVWLPFDLRLGVLDGRISIDNGRIWFDDSDPYPTGTRLRIDGIYYRSLKYLPSDRPARRLSVPFIYPMALICLLPAIALNTRGRDRDTGSVQASDRVE